MCAVRVMGSVRSDRGFYLAGDRGLFEVVKCLKCPYELDSHE